MQSSTTKRRDRKQTGVYVTPGVKRRLEAHRHANKCETIDIVFDAIAENHLRLAQIIEESKYYLGTLSPLFPPDPRKIRYTGGGDAQILFAPTEPQAEVLSKIEAELGFKYRSTWIAPILNEYLPGKKERNPNPMHSKSGAGADTSTDASGT